MNIRFSGGIPIAQVDVGPQYQEVQVRRKLEMLDKVTELRRQGRSAAPMTIIKTDGDGFSKRHYVVATDSDAEDLQAIYDSPRMSGENVITPQYIRPELREAEENLTEAYRRLSAAQRELIHQKAKLGIH